MPKTLPRTISLRVRLAGSLCLVFLVGMLSLYFAARSHAEAAANRSYDRLLLGSALSIAETISIAGEDVRVDLPYAALDMLSAAPDDRVFYSVTGPRGDRVTGDTDLPSEAGFRDHEGPYFFDAEYKGEMVRFAVLARQIARAQQTGWIKVQVGQTRRARNAFAGELLLSALLPIAGMTVAALGSVWLIIGWALRPLHSIGRNLAGRQPNDLTPIDTAAPSDLAQLVVSLNMFMTRLRENIDALRSFIAEAAHQMRTPLAALRAQAQTIDTDDPEDMKRGLAAVERNAEKLTRLLNQLLSDSTVTHRSDVRDFEEFDLRRTIRLCLQEAVPQHGVARYAFHCDLDEAPLTGDVVMIGEAIKNLIHNAVTHGGGENIRIDVSLHVEGLRYIVMIEDRGPGISEASADSLFKRFSRQNTSVSGFGLGLAIVKRVVDSHGGTISLSNRKGGGLSARIELPRLLK